MSDKIIPNESTIEPPKQTNRQEAIAQFNTLQELARKFQESKKKIKDTTQQARDIKIDPTNTEDQNIPKDSKNTSG